MKDIFCPSACKKITKEFCNKHSLLLECFLIFRLKHGSDSVYLCIFFFTYKTYLLFEITVPEVVVYLFRVSKARNTRKQI